MPTHDYVPRLSVGSPQPFDATGVRMYGFVFWASHDCLVELCNKYLNRPANRPGAYQPIPGFTVAIFNFSHANRIAPRNPPYSTFGYSAETELAIWVPLHTADFRLVWFTPYTFVDNPLAVSQGREIYGFPKEMARVTVPSEGAPAARFAVTAQAVDKLTTESELKWLPILSLSGRPLSPPGTDGHWTSYDGAQRALHATVAAHASSLGIRHTLAPEGLPWPPRGTCVFLKQFPAAEDGRVTAYQGIVEADITIPDTSQFRGWPDLGSNYRLTLPYRPSHPISTDLGVGDGDAPLIDYYFEFDFTLEAGREVWRADSKASSAPSPSPFTIVSNLVNGAINAIQALPLLGSILQRPVQMPVPAVGTRPGLRNRSMQSSPQRAEPPRPTRARRPRRKSNRKTDRDETRA